MTISSPSNAISSSLMATMNGAPSTAATSSAGAAGASASVSTDESNFLQLLVTQMKNQDPLNPLDNAQVTSQLAQLSTVTGVNQLNTTLSSLVSDFQSSQTVQATSMIGHSVLSAGNTLALTNGSGALGLQLGTAANDVKVTITNGAGVAVNTIDLGPQAAGTLPLTWNGKDSSGNQLPDGTYSFAVAATAAGVPLTDATTLGLSTVNSISTNAQGVTLNTSAGNAVSLAAIKQVM